MIAIFMAIFTPFVLHPLSFAQMTKFPPLPKVQLEPLIDRLLEPVGALHAGDGSGRIFIVEQHGTIRIWKGGKLYEKPFLDIGDRVISGGERGLLGLAFHPQFSKNGRLFVNYTSPIRGLHTVISEFKVGAYTDWVDPKSERIILKIPQPYPNHNGGHILFGPDGYLYIGMGDGGSANDPHGYGQNLASLLGKMLRIDVDQSEGPYAVPSDNPFVNDKEAAPEVWAYGLRNPWRFSFDNISGLLYAGDVGQNDREEVDVIRKGGNYGWNIMEGNICTPGVAQKCKKKGLKFPILDYPRSEGTTVIGGHVYRGVAMIELRGAYIYGDFGSGKVWGLRYNGKTVALHQLLLQTDRNISAFGVDEQREMYLVDYMGEILKIVPDKRK